jgi:Cu(I)/Ag(I) efflux system membrane protein CusA/SilA
MVGGIVTSFILELLIYPAIYVLWKSWFEVRQIESGAAAEAVAVGTNQSS